MDDKKFLKEDRFLLNAEEFEAVHKIKKSSWNNFTDLEVVESDKEFIHQNNVENVGKVLFTEDEEEGEKYYAEEVYDEGEEVIFDDIHDSEVIVEKRLSYKDIVTNLDEAFKGVGLKEDKLALNFLSSMQFSRLINLKPTENLIDGVNALFNALDNPKFIIDYEDETTIASSATTMELLNFAKEKPFKAVFVYIRGLDSKNIFKYLRPFYPYIDNPNGDCFISAQGKSLYIPHNIYFLVSLDANDVIFDTQRRLLRYLGTLYTPLTLGEVEVENPPYELNTEVIVKASRDANELYSVSEASWKKLDNIVEVVHRVNNYTLENKISRRVEDFVVVQLANEVEEDDALDICLSHDVFQELIVTTRPLMYLKECNITKELNGQFGNNRMPLTKETVSKYLALFDKGGKRKDA